MKRYVCQVCHGSGKETFFHEHDKGLDRVPCGACVERGMPPFIEIDEPVNRAIVDALGQDSLARIMKLDGHARGCNGDGCIGECAMSPCPHGTTAMRCPECRP